LFNPFRGEVLKSVFARMRESLVRLPRSLTVVYYHPPALWEHEACCDWLSRTMEFVGASGFRLCVYKTTEK
jgi:hypothetical protein